jgi:hypothetical protein
MTPRQSARLKVAELRLAYSCAATRGLYIGTVFLDGAKGGGDDAEPDALYVTRFNPYDETLLYDVRRCRFLTISWPDWYEAQGAAW